MVYGTTGGQYVAPSATGDSYATLGSNHSVYAAAAGTPSGTAASPYYTSPSDEPSYELPPDHGASAMWLGGAAAESEM